MALSNRSTRDLSLLTKRDMIRLLKILVYRPALKQFEKETWYKEGTVRRISAEEVQYIAKSPLRSVHKVIFKVGGEVELWVRYVYRRKYHKHRRPRSILKVRKLFESFIKIDADLQYSVYIKYEDGVLKLDRELSNVLTRLKYKPTVDETLSVWDDDSIIPVRVMAVETYLYIEEEFVRHIITVKKFY